jgi:competence protein ComEC
VRSASAPLARHPRHLALAGLAVGLPLAEAGWSACAIAAACLALAVALTGRGTLAVAVVAFVMAGGMVGSARIDAIDRTEVDRWIGREVDALGYLVRRERPLARRPRARVRLTAVRPAAEWVGVEDLVQVALESGRPPAGIAVGDEVVLRGALDAPRSNPGRDFDYGAYLRRQGVHAILRARSIRVTGRRRGGLPGIVDAIRRRAESGVSAGLSGVPASLARGIVLGQDELIPSAVADDFTDSGLAHLLAVSGQNVTLLALLALPLLAAAGFGRRARFVGVLLLIAVYVPLTGAGPSILRAGAMGAAGTVAALTGRPASRWYALLLAACFTLTLDPRAWRDPGWQLSFAAVIGLMALAPRAADAASRLRVPDALAAAVAVTLAATIATAPLTAFHFGRVSLVTVPANLLALPAVAPIMWLGTLAAVAAQLSPAPAALVNGLSGYCLAYLASVARASAAIPGAALELEAGAMSALAASYGALTAIAVVVMLVARRRQAKAGRARLAVAVGAVLLSAAAGFAAGAPAPAPQPRLAVTFLDVGQGDATLVQAPGDVAVLIDGGPADSRIVAKLRAAGVRSLDLLVLTHAQADHQDGLERVFRELPVALLLDGGGADRAHRRIVALARSRGTRVVGARAGQLLHARRLRLRVLHPPRPADGGGDPNRESVVLLASYRGFDVLLPADAESEVTLGLPPRRVELLKVAHHGSADAGLAELVARLRPEVAVIEVGAGNRFGHPSPSTLRILARAVPRVLRTDRDGDVRVSPGRDGPHVETSE